MEMTASEGTKARCIFCGARNSKLTNEHVLPKAVRDAFPGLKTSKFYRQPSGSPQVESWEGPSFEQKVRVVCGECNHTWMSAIEKEAAPFLLDMVRPGKGITLDAHQQSRLAAWAYLKAVTGFGWCMGRSCVGSRRERRRDLRFLDQGSGGRRASLLARLLRELDHFSPILDQIYSPELPSPPSPRPPA
jgi:hypothetical protein